MKYFREAETCVLHEDAFYAFFKPIPQSNSQFGTWGGFGLETYGEDLRIIRNHDPDFVWTVVDGDSGDQWLVSGVQYVNRTCHLITEQPHFSTSIHFRIPRNSRSLTPLGLKRQLIRLKRHLASAGASV